MPESSFHTPQLRTHSVQPATQQTPSALRKLLEDLGEDSPLPAPPQFGRYDSSGGKSQSGEGMRAEGGDQEPVSPVFGKGRNGRNSAAELSGSGSGRMMGSPLVRSSSEAGIIGLQAGRMDAYDFLDKRDFGPPHPSSSHRSASSSSQSTHTPPSSGTSIRSTSSHASTSTSASYRSTSGLTNSSATTSGSVTLTPPYDDANRYGHAPQMGSGDSGHGGMSRAGQHAVGFVEGKKVYGPASRSHTSQTHRPFGRTVSQPAPHSSRDLSATSVDSASAAKGDENERYMLGRITSAGGNRMGMASTAPAVDLVAVLGRKMRDSGEMTAEHEAESERSQGMTSENSTLGNSSTTTLVPVRPSAIRTHSNTSSRTNDSPSALTASTSNAYTPANPARILSSSTTSATRSRLRLRVPPSFGLPVRPRPDMLVEAEAGAEEAQLHGSTQMTIGEETYQDSGNRSFPPSTSRSSPEHRISPIRVESNQDPPNRYSPTSRPHLNSIPSTIEEDEEVLAAKSHYPGDLLQRPLLPRPVTARPRSTSHSPVYDNGGSSTIVAGGGAQATTSTRPDEGHRRSPSHPHLSGSRILTDLVAWRDAPVKPVLPDPYASFDLVRRNEVGQDRPVEASSSRPASAASFYRSSPPLPPPSAPPHYQDPVQGQYGQYDDQMVRTMTPAPPAGKKVFSVNKLDYERLYKLGKGGSGTVYAVLHPVKRIAVALKRVAFNGCDAETIANYKNEVDLLARLSGHDRIIKLLDFEITVGGNGKAKSLTVVMEAGEASFDALLDEQSHKPLNLSWVAMYWEQMLEGVQAVHEQRVVHTDLKPANFVLVKGKLKIIDFGIAKAIANDTVNIHRDQQIGSINYMSPEAINKMNTGDLYKLGFPSDVWSMGCILYQMIYGKCPFSQIQGGAFAKFAYIGGGQFTIRYKKRYNSEAGAFAKDEKDEPADCIVTKAAIDAMEACLRFDQHDRKTIPELMECSFLHPERDLKATVITRSNMAQLVAATYNVRDLIENGRSRDILDAKGRVVGEETVVGANPQERLATYAAGLMEQLQMVNGQLSTRGF